MERRVTAEEISLTLAWAEETGNPELLTAVRLQGGLALKLSLQDRAGGDALLEQIISPLLQQMARRGNAPIVAMAPPPLPAILFLALEARGQRLIELAALLQQDTGTALALGTSLLLDRSDPAAAAYVLGPAAFSTQPNAELAARFCEYALLAAESYIELVDLLARRAPAGFAKPEVRRAEALWRAGFPEARQAFAQLVEESFDAYARARLEEVLEADGDYRALAELYKKALNKTPSPNDRSLILLRLGEILEDHLDDPAGAARYYAQAEGGQVNAAISSRRRALARKAKDWEAYADCLREEALHVEDRRRAAALNLIAGRTLLEAVGDSLEAARAFEDALRLYPEDGRCREFLAESLLLAGDVEALADLHAGPMASLIRREAQKLGDMPIPIQVVAAHRAGDQESLAQAFRRWSEPEENPFRRAAYLTLAAQFDPDRGRARQDASAALFVSKEFLPALLTMARLWSLEGRLRPSMDALIRAAEVTGEGQIRMILLLEAAKLGEELSDPDAVAALHRTVSSTLFGQKELPLDAGSLADMFGEGGDWQQHTAAILREARRAGQRRTLLPLLIELIRRGQSRSGEHALRTLLELVSLRTDQRNLLIQVLEGKTSWNLATPVLDQLAQGGLETGHKVARLARVSMIPASRERQRAERSPSPPQPEVPLASLFPDLLEDEPVVSAEQPATGDRPAEDRTLADPIRVFPDVAPAPAPPGPPPAVKINENLATGSSSLPPPQPERAPSRATARVRRKAAANEGELPEDLITQAEACENWDEAITLFLVAGERARRQSAWAVAEEAYQQVLARDASEPRALAALAELCRQTGDWHAAREWLSRLYEVETEREARLDILLLRARIAAEEEEDQDAAILDYEACLVIDPRCPEALAALETFYKRKGDYQALRMLYLQGLEQVTNARPVTAVEQARQLELLVSLADLEQQQLDRPQGAIVYLKRALALKPGEVGLLRKLAEMAGRAQQWRERVEALEVLARQVKDPGERSNLYLEIARIYRDHLGGGGVVLENTMVAFVCDNANRRAFDELEHLYVAERRWREALGIYDVALGAIRNGAPYQAEELTRRKGLLMARHLDTPREATEVLLQALKAAPEDGEVLDALELLLAQTRNLEHRIRMLEIQAEARQGRSRMELLMLAAELSVSLPGHERTRERYYRRALQAVPEVEEKPFVALELLYRQGQRWEELLTLYEELGQTKHLTPVVRRQLLLRRAQILEAELRDTERAVAVYQQLLEQQDGDPEALRALARLYEARRAWDELLAVSRRELSLTQVPGERALLLFRIGSILETQRRDESGAEEAYRAALQEDPRCFPALHGLRDLYLRRGEWARAVETLEREAPLWEEPRDRAAILVHLGDLLHTRLQDPDGAVAAYRRALATSPGLPAAARALLPLLIRARQWTEAAPLARLVTRLAATTPQQDAAARLLALTQRSLVALELGELTEAAGALQLALQLSPQDESALQIAQQLVLHPAAGQLSAETLEGLLHLLEQTPALATQIAHWIPILRGRAAEARYQIDEALRHYRVAIRAMPTSLEGHRPLTALLARLRRWSEIIEVLTPLASEIRTTPERARVLLRLGQLRLDRLGELARARVYFQQVMADLDQLRQADDERYGEQEERTWREALLLSAQVAYLEERWSDGEALLRLLVEAEEQDPRGVHGPASLGLYLYYLGRFLRDGLARREEAAACFYQSIQESSGMVEPVIAYGRLLWQEGDREELDELLESQLPFLQVQQGSAQSLRLRFFQSSILLQAGELDAALNLFKQALTDGEEPVLTRRLFAFLCRRAERPDQASAVLRDALLHGAPPLRILRDLATLWEEQGEQAQAALLLSLLQELKQAADERAPLGLVSGAPASAGSWLGSPLEARLLLPSIRHPEATELLISLWPSLVAHQEPAPPPPNLSLEPLRQEQGWLFEISQRTLQRLGGGRPPLKVLAAARLTTPVALLDDQLLIGPWLLRTTDPDREVLAAFWMAGALLLLHHGLSLAAHPDPAIPERMARGCVAIMAEASGVAVPSAWLPGGQAPRAAVQALIRGAEQLGGIELKKLGQSLPDPDKFLTGLRRTTHRAGLVALGHPVAALRALRAGLGLPLANQLHSEPQDVLDLLHFCLGEVRGANHPSESLLSDSSVR